MRETGTVTTWIYDATHRLTRERVGTGTPTTYVYDAVGNRTLQLTGSRVTYSYDAANQLVRSQSGATLTTYAYDNAGNRRLLQTTSRTTYVWDDENRMVTSQPAIATNYTYDPDNLRVTASNTNTRHVWDGQNAIEERDSSSNAIQVAYTLEPLLYGNLISQRRSGASSYYLFDALGNTVNLTDAAQNKPNSYTYPGAYGTFSLQASGSPLSNNLVFVGRQGYYAGSAPSNSLIYIRNRWYDPSTASWMSPDPIGFRGGDWNLYRYVKNNPVTNVDATGLLRDCANCCPGDSEQTFPKRQCGGVGLVSDCSLTSSLLARRVAPLCKEVAEALARAMYPLPQYNIGDQQAFQHCYASACLIGYGVNCNCAHCIGYERGIFSSIVRRPEHPEVCLVLRRAITIIKLVALVLLAQERTLQMVARPFSSRVKR